MLTNLVIFFSLAFRNLSLYLDLGCYICLLRVASLIIIKAVFLLLLLLGRAVRFRQPDFI